MRCRRRGSPAARRSPGCPGRAGCLAEGAGALLVGAHAVGGAVDADDDASVQEAVQGGRGEHGVAEPLGPGRDADVGRGDDAALEVAGVDDLEEQGPGFLVQDPVAQLVDHEQPGRGEEPEAGGEAVLGDRAAEPADEVLAGGEQDLVAGLGGGAGQRDRQHGLAGSRGPYEDDAGGLVDEAEGGEVADEGLVGAWLGGEVVVLDPPGGRQGGPVEAGGELAGLGGGGLGAHELVEGVQDGQLPVAGVVEQAGQGLDGGAELEVGEVAAEPLVGGRVVVRGGHAGSPFPVFLVLPGGRGGAAAVPGGRGGGEPARSCPRGSAPTLNAVGPAPACGKENNSNLLSPFR